MVVDETDRFIIRAEIMFASQKKRLSYVNSELGCVILADLTVHPKDKQRSISMSTYYKRLGAIGKNTRERMAKISLGFEERLVTYLEELYLVIHLKWEDYWKLKADGRVPEANKILNDIVAIQPYIVNQEEAVQLTMENEQLTIQKSTQTPPDSLLRKSS